MAKYAVTFARSARKEMEALPRHVGARVVRRIEALSSEPRPAGCRKLQGAEDLWRVRVGEYRVIYTISDPPRVVDVVAVRHRRDAYR